MFAFEIHLNGKRLCVAGIGDHGVLNAAINSVAMPQRRYLSLMVGGLISPTEEHVGWVNRKISVGDEIRVKVLETDSVDEPANRQPTDSAAKMAAQKSYVRRMARELGWVVKAQPRKQVKRRRK